MALREELERSGNWLFRWRSYLPLCLSIIILAGVLNEHSIAGKLIDSTLWKIFCMNKSFVGLCIRIYVIGHAPHGTSGGNTRRKVANLLNTTGAYSIVRHPLYLGNFLIWLGISAFLGVWWMILVFILIFWLYYERIMFAEEEFLRNKFGSAFVGWAEVTPAFIPKFNLWIIPSIAFSIKKVLRREYSPFFAIISIYTALEILSCLAIERAIRIDTMWVVLFFSGLAIYMVLRILKKKTRWLEEAYDS